MKSNPLRRRVGLKTNTPLRQGKPIKRIPATGSSSVQPKRKRKNTDPATTVTDRVKERSEGVCEIQIPGLCTGVATDVHHRSGRGMGGTSRPEIDQAANLMHACRSCHDAVTNTRGRRAEYERARWIVRRSADTLTKPVLRRGVWVLLDNKGAVVPVEKGEAA